MEKKELKNRGEEERYARELEFFRAWLPGLRPAGMNRKKRDADKNSRNCFAAGKELYHSMNGKIWKTGALMLAGAAVVSGAALTGMAKGAQELWEYELVSDEQDNQIYEFEELSLTVPAEWEEKYEVIPTDDDGVYFSSVAIRNEYPAERRLPYIGELFAVNRCEDYSFKDLPMWTTVLGSSDDYIYYLSLFQGDVRYGSSEEASEEWLAMREDIDWIIENAEVTNPGGGFVDMEEFLGGDEDGADDGTEAPGDSEYILADSSEEYLEESDLEGMSAADMQMAINEIYARHGRKFATKEIQKYFDAKSWYSGTVEPAKFDPASLNACENANVALLLRCMSALPSASGTFSGSTGGASSGASASGSGSSLFGNWGAGRKMVATDTVNIRSKASTSGVVMGIVPQGCSVEVTGSTSDGWVPVRYNGIKGYVSAQYLTASGAGQSSTSGAGQASSGQSSVSGAGQTSSDQSSVSGAGQTSSSQSSVSGAGQASSGTGSAAGTSGAGAGSAASSSGAGQSSTGDSADDSDGAGSAARVYEGGYYESACFECLMPEELPNYYVLEITNVTGDSFGFCIEQLDRMTYAVLQTVLTGTATMTEDGTGAVYEGANGDVYFSFPNYHNAYPDVTDIEVSGVDELAGKVMVNNGVPGHEFN